MRPLELRSLEALSNSKLPIYFYRPVGEKFNSVVATSICQGDRFEVE